LHAGGVLGLGGHHRLVLPGLVDVVAQLRGFAEQAGLQKRGHGSAFGGCESKRVPGLQDQVRSPMSRARLDELGFWFIGNHREPLSSFGR